PSGGVAPYTYKWSGGTTNALVTGLSTGNYSLAIEDADGCSASTILSLIPPLVQNACCDTIILLGQSVQLNAAGGGIYQWSPNSGLSCDSCPNPIATPAQSTLYTVTVTDSSGCNS